MKYLSLSMKLTHVSLIVALTTLAVSFLSCNSNTDTANSTVSVTRKNCNAIYHWKTVFNPDSTEWNFIKQHNIGRLYVRMFDVANDPTNNIWSDDNRIIPIGTTRFLQQIPDSIEVVPTVFITMDAFKTINGSLTGELAQKIFNRVSAMCVANNIPNVHEIQIDCDYDEYHDWVFDDFCKKMKELLPDTMVLSATIRLHQLRSKQQLPSIDRGVLMVYNTGNIRSPKTKNSILDINDIKPYFSRSLYTKIPLDVAYPTFQWSLLFRNNSFKGILHRMNWDDTKLYQPIDSNRYRVLCNHNCGETALKEGDIIRTETSDIDMILQVKRKFDEKLNFGSTILYHLDDKNLSTYSTDEIHKIYTGR